MVLHESPREITSVCERLRAFMGVSRVATSLEPEPVSNAPVSKRVAREFTSVYERLREIQHDDALVDLSDRCQPGVKDG